MTETETLTFAPLTEGDLAAAVALSRAEPWPHRPEDWALFLSLGKGVGARLGDRLVGTALAIPFGPVASACMIIVAAEMRGRGLGRALMERTMALATPREWRLVATEDGLPLYEKLGFRAGGRIFQHQGPVVAVTAPENVAWATPRTCRRSPPSIKPPPGRTGAPCSRPSPALDNSPSSPMAAAMPACAPSAGARSRVP